jgi:tRNA-uridine aminocarboxypropyltransferase
VRLATPIAIVQHAAEQGKPTNTGRLFARMVEGTALLPYGRREPPFDPKPLEDPSVDWRLLFLRPGAAVLDPAERPASGRRLGFVVLDGTWTQCARMGRRIAAVADLPCVALPAGPPSIWGVRTQRDERGLSTFEAAVRAIELVEGPAAIAPVRHAFALVTGRLLYIKGKPRSPEIPADLTAPSHPG